MMLRSSFSDHAPFVIISLTAASTCGIGIAKVECGPHFKAITRAKLVR